MNNKKTFIILYIFIILEILILFNSKDIINNIIHNSSVFFFSIFPSLFPNMVIGNILCELNIHKIIPKFIKKFLNINFNFNNNAINIYLLSMICGTPTNAILINKYLENDKITEKEAESLLCTTHFINPLFVIGSVGIGIFKSSKTGLLLLTTLYISNFIKAYILRNNFNKNHNYLSDNNINVTSLFSASIKKSMDSLILIFGIIIMFNILILLVTNIFNLNLITSSIIKCMLEMTSGIQVLKTLNINYYIKIFLAYYTLSFGGVCIWMQATSMINNKKKISYLKYLIFRIT